MGRDIEMAGRKSLVPPNSLDAVQWQRGRRNQVDRKKLDSPLLWDKLARLFLRTIPLVPAPEIFDLLKEVQHSQGELGQKVSQAAASLGQASRLVEELEGELSTKVRQVERLKSEYERYEQLAAVEEGKAKAMIDELALRWALAARESGGLRWASTFWRA